MTAVTFAGAGTTVVAEAANITGTNRSDVLIGQAGVPDTILGRDGDDRIVILGHAGWDEIDCGEGSDTLDLSRIRMRERTGAHLDTHRAPNSQVFNCENVIGTDSRIGDDLQGDGNDNRLTGGRGGDRLVGGPGADRFAYRSQHDSPPADPDRIVDFNPADGDRIDFSALAKALRKRGAPPLQFIGENSFSGRRGQVRAADGAVQIDLDGNRAADLVISVGTVSAGIPSSAIVLK